MEINKQLYNFINEHSQEITDEWLSKRKKGSRSVYSKEADTYTLNQITEHNQALLDAVSKVFISEKANPTDEMIDWIKNVSELRVSDNTPIHEVIEQFHIFRRILWNRVKEFVWDNDINMDRALKWGDLLNDTFDFMLHHFSEHYYETHMQQMYVQEQLINDLSAPIIPINKNEAILPLIGDLDTTRTTYIQTSTLKQCNETQYDTLYIDMSGVQNIDTIVAHHLFQLIQSLDLLGVSSVVCGMNPRVAQVGVQLGIDFSQIKVRSTLSHALNS